MRRTALNSVLAVLALSVAACSSNPSPAAPAPQPAPAAQPAAVPARAPAAAPAPAPAPPPAPPPAPAAARYVLTGEWEWSSIFQGQPYSGTMTLELSGGSYTGTIRVSGQFDATVRTASLSGNTVRIFLDSPQGEMVLEAQFTDANTLTGRVDVVAAGDAATFSAVRR
jgi:pyruvate/2-oxoglutarate dehydrogenase complex dihydrolipoamide acyltransferase (E2) component